MTGANRFVPMIYDGGKEAVAIGRARVWRRGSRMRMVVLAANASDAVRGAGGWLFDRSMAGWDITVLADSMTDSRSVRILGADARDLSSALGPRVRGSQPQALAVSSALLAGNARVRDEVLGVLDRGVTEVTVWGRGRPAALEGRMGSTAHRLSRAAWVFKCHALHATGAVGADVSLTESFGTNHFQWCDRSCRDFGPVR
ncbi:hypothetical protein [Nocardia sp. NPDC051750]|uniref:hypothetical protein n=1 Tax=Nocardia sp. NPDC051750 TaxID=3364325 RepID=UPI0037A58B7A